MYQMPYKNENAFIRCEAQMHGEWFNELWYISSGPRFQNGALVSRIQFLRALAGVPQWIFDVLSQKQGNGDFSLLVFSQGSQRSW